MRTFAPFPTARALAQRLVALALRRLGSTAGGGYAGLLTGGSAWDGRTEDGQVAGSGVYFLRLTAPGVSATREAVRFAP